MKKILPIIIVGVLISGGLGAVATPVGEYKNQKTSSTFSQLLIQEKEGYLTLELEGANSVLMKKDHYMLPTCIETFTFPFGTEIESILCTPKNIQSQKVTKELMITPEPVIISQFTKNKQAGTIKNIPKTIQKWYEYDVGAGMINRNERGIIVKVETFPVQYDPSKNIIEWAESIDIEIKYNTPETPITFNDDYSLIILGKEEFSDELNDLIQHKINRGISTKFVSDSEIYDGTYFPVQGRDNQEKIKYFIKDAIENWGTSNVLLVGGSSKFPSRTTHVKAADNDMELFVSDLYYADIYNDVLGFSSWDTNENDIFGEYDWNGETDDVDLYPDVFLGRIACVNAPQVTTTVEKIITYEENEAYTQGWFGDLIVVGGDSFPGDDDEIDEGEYLNQAVIDVMDGFVPNKIWASEGDLSGYVPSGVTKLSNALNEGAGFVDFSGHGNPRVWATHPHEDENTWLPTPYGSYYNSDVASLSNGEELPIVIIGACSVSKYNQQSDCFGWSFVSNPNGGGIASLGATGLGWAYIGTGVTQGLIEGMALTSFEVYKDDGALTFGEIWGKAITEYIHTGMEGVDYKTIEEWQPFGDPTLAVGEESEAPSTPEDLNGPTSGQINEEHTYTASTTDPEGDKIYYLFDWGDGEFSGWVGEYSSGATAQASHTWTEEGDYEIRVKAKDDHGVQSEWSDPLPITMPRNKGVINSIILEILEKLIERFPLLEQILRSRPVIDYLLKF
jgi:hypothetical protein